MGNPSSRDLRLPFFFYGAIAIGVGLTFAIIIVGMSPGRRRKGLSEGCYYRRDRWRMHLINFSILTCTQSGINNSPITFIGRMWWKMPDEIFFHVQKEGTLSPLRQRKGAKCPGHHDFILLPISVSK